MKSHMLSESAKFLYGQYEGIKALIGEEPSSGTAVSEAVTALKEGDIASDTAELSEGRKEEADYAVENTVMVHIRHIREKIEIDAKNPKYLKVVWGIGYKMEKYS